MDIFFILQTNTEKLTLSEVYRFSLLLCVFAKVCVLSGPRRKTSGGEACGERKEKVCTSASVWRDLWLDQTKECKGVYSERVWEERFTIRRTGHNSKFTLTYITF